MGRLRLSSIEPLDATLGTDLIVSFSGEMDDEFERSRAFCAEMRFSRMHVFRYSRRPSTPAAALDAQVDPPPA